MKASDYSYPVGSSDWNDGLTNRDYIAIQAMNGLLSSEGEEGGYYSATEGRRSLLARTSYALADAMIEESNK